ncbi:polysaccharide deacetylase family protein [Acetatifactor muris]|uniref:Polysaccharide deacetylase n=1 Tax=Acetatifactor muris TaxID=879566 RepID=A0A2K4ZK63_9FIRM|nr:polysaccharide deacetylase family protein [Acetatifactor muris]MCI8798917.1 polysaccharide deacetylase family protein [Lachnospiraceae bacterium]MCR2049230.1 polysaccharide deacetylase family protein [Acetatifactor muris]SOY30850.1 Polysaccharide deacetylase [Acetatifactor muris]
MGIIGMRFPGGKKRALTLSYDDGVEQDARLIDIMKKHGLKGTFNISSGLYAPEGKTWPEGTIHRRMSKKTCQELYGNSGMEVAVHGLTHPWLEQLPENLCTFEVLQDRMNLEAEYGTMVRGMAYPFGTYNDSVVDTLKRCGIVYSRTVEATEKFDIPTDWLRMPATCHHNSPRLMELAHKFVDNPFPFAPGLFYLWGHSYEFEANDNWQVIEEFADFMGNREDIWYATNIEIYDYIAACKQLIFSMDQKKVYNPTFTTLYFRMNMNDYSVKPGETLICE